jgi:hypothetical protein
MPGAAMGIVIAPPLQRDADDVGDAVQLEGMTPISNATEQETRGPTRQNHDSIADVQVDKPAAHERVVSLC